VKVRRIKQKLWSCIPNIRGLVVRVLAVYHKGGEKDLEALGLFEVSLHPYFLRIKTQMGDLTFM